MIDKLIIQQNHSLKAHHTFATEATCAYCVTLDNAEQLKRLSQMTEWQSLPHFVLGGGSNTLFLSDFDGLIVINQIQGIDKTKENDEFVWLKIGAGVNWHELVMYAIEHDYGGIENLSLIPGTVGAAPIQNIGAYGVEIESVFVELSATHLRTLEQKTFQHSDCEFAYRNSIFKRGLTEDYLITSVTLKLTKHHDYNVNYGQIRDVLDEQGVEQLSLRAISDAVIRIRQRKLPDPNKLPNAGSFFKNPIINQHQFATLEQQYPKVPHYPTTTNDIKIPAAWLIEQCGFKGKRQGNVGSHQHQPLVLINYDRATGQDILQFANSIQAAVKQTFAIELTPEVTLV